MKAVPFLGGLALLLAFVSGTIDLNNLYNYENQFVPAYITKDNTPADNPITDEGATLGRVLFYDKQLSLDMSTSCASCHSQEFAFSDTAQQSLGINGLSGRHSMRLINARFGDEVEFFWDRRALSLEDQTTQPIQDHIEMGFSGTLGDPAIDSLLRRMRTIDYYPELFEFAFGDTAITEERMQKALAQFVRSIQSFDSKFDTGRSLVGSDVAPFPNYTADENAGKQLFIDPPIFDPLANRLGGGVGCAACHRPPEFDIDPGSENNAVIASFTLGLDFSNTRSPSLRDMVNASGQANGGFMHDGGVTTGLTINGVLDHYNQIPGVFPAMDPRLRVAGNPQNLMLTPVERMQLIAFMETLTGSNIYTDPRWSDPFVGGSLDLIALQCQTPATLESSNVTATGAELRWSKVSDALGYRITGTELSSGRTSSRYRFSPNDTALIFSGVLSPANSYVWFVEAGCGPSDFSAPTSVDTFTTPTVRSGQFVSSERISPLAYPNPAIGVTQLKGLPANSTVAVEIFDLLGRLSITQLVHADGAGVAAVELSALEKGAYLISLRGNGWQESIQLSIVSGAAN